MREYTISPTTPSNYKVGVLYRNGYISLTNHKTIQSAAEEMRHLGASFNQCPEAWEDVINIFIMEG